MKKNNTLQFPKRKITHLTTEEIIYKEFVKKGKLTVDAQGRIWREESKFGRIRAESVSTNNRGQTQSQVRVDLNGMKIACTASRLAWLALKGRIPHFKVVTTKDGDKSNTHPRNMFLCSHRESIAYHKRAA